MTEKEFAAWMGKLAQRDMQKSGVLASVTTAQAILESGYGTTDLAQNANNFFGMKCSLSGNTWPGSTWDGTSKYSKITQEDDGTGRMYPVRADFRKYPAAADSLADHSAYLLGAMNGSRKRYAGLKGERDPRTAIQIIKNGGYATDTRYVDKIMSIIERFNLTSFDGKGGGQMDLNIINVMPQNAGQVPAHKDGNPEFAVVHYLGVANADNENLYGGGYGGHFYVSRAGQAYQAADPAKDVVWQCGGGRQGYDPGSGSYFGICTNYNSVGIECGVCMENGTWYFTTETQETLVKLVSYLMDKYGIPIDHVIRHWDVTGKHCPAPYVENTGYKTSWTWDQFKQRLADYRSGKKTTTDYVYKPKKVIEGYQGPEASILEAMFYARGFYKKSWGMWDNSCGPKLVRAIRDYQTARAGQGAPIAIDGKCETMTWGDLLGTGKREIRLVPLSGGEKNLSVLFAQQLLKGYGFYKGTLDWSNGPKTVKATKRLQKKLRMKQTGKWDAKLYKRICTDPIL